MPAHTFEGVWHMTSHNVYTGALFTDVTGPKEEVATAPVEEQDEWESRRLWRWVAKGIRDGDYDAASREKSKIEVRARFSPGPGLRADTPACVCFSRTSRGRDGKTSRRRGRCGR